MKHVLPLEEVSLEHLAQVGGKNASLGEMIGALASAGVRVPGGFALTSGAFRAHMAQDGMGEQVLAELAGLDATDVSALAATARAIRQRIVAAPLPRDVADEARSAYEELSRAAGEEARRSPCARARPPRICRTPLSRANRRRS
jgi:pyruvate,water dikinase